jgi:RNA polymerase sigma-70 factor, ECF subfamily
LHEAIERLATIDPRQARVVELRYFGGMNIEDTAEALDVSPATIKREWAVARAWLRRDLSAS